MKERWRHLLRYLDPARPPSDMALYVKPPRSSAGDICDAFEADPTSFQKFLLVGARGGGKSTELRQVARRLAGKATLATIDLDASGISPSSVSAFDLLYISGLALLAQVPEGQRDSLFKQLSQAYTDQDASDLGDLDAALQGLASFASAGAALGASLGADTVLPGASAGLAMVSTGLRLLTRKDSFVAESSPMGRRLQEACVLIARAVRQGDDKAPICVLMDGLERMNGEAEERFEEIFCRTRLLADTEWISAIAAPPSTLTRTNSANGAGYRVLPVYGFDPDQASDLGDVITLLEHRCQAAAIEVPERVPRHALERIARASGGLPRHAVQIAHGVVQRALLEDAAAIEAHHIDAGIGRLAETLALGLTSEDVEILGRVARSARLPGEERAAKLFADSRVLAHPPVGPSHAPRFRPHPLLEGELPPAPDPGGQGRS